MDSRNISYGDVVRADFVEEDASTANYRCVRQYNPGGFQGIVEEFDESPL